MRIVSLLPSLTELVCALGRGEWLVGVSHECDYPAGLESLPKLTASRIAVSASSAEIDAQVAEQGGSLYSLDAARLAELRPDLILTQAQCDVCAVNEATVHRVAEALPGRPRVETVNPTDLAGVYAMFLRIGRLLDATVAAENLIGAIESTTEEIARRRRGLRPVPTLVLEWTDPPYTTGHWNPDLIARAGGRELLGVAGLPSRRATWDEIGALVPSPDAVIVAPCGYTLERTAEDLGILEARPEWSGLQAVCHGQVTLADGSAYFARPGPRLEESLRIAAAAIDPERCADLAPAEGMRRLVLES